MSTEIKLLPLRTIINIDQSSLNWKPAHVDQCNQYYEKYEMEIADHPEYGQVIRPTKPYECTWFENFFGFSNHCSNFTKDRTIYLHK